MLQAEQSSRTARRKRRAAARKRKYIQRCLPLSLTHTTSLSLISLDGRALPHPVEQRTTTRIKESFSWSLHFCHSSPVFRSEVRRSMTVPHSMTVPSLPLRPDLALCFYNASTLTFCFWTPRSSPPLHRARTQTKSATVTPDYVCKKQREHVGYFCLLSQLPHQDARTGPPTAPESCDLHSAKRPV